MSRFVRLAGRAGAFDRWLKADTGALETLTERVRSLRAGRARLAGTADYFMLLAVAFGVVGLSMLIAEPLSAWFAANAPWSRDFSFTSSFFWLIVCSTTFGLLLSFISVPMLTLLTTFPIQWPSIFTSIFQVGGVITVLGQHIVNFMVFGRK